MGLKKIEFEVLEKLNNENKLKELHPEFGLRLDKMRHTVNFVKSLFSQHLKKKPIVIEKTKWEFGVYKETVNGREVFYRMKEYDLCQLPDTPSSGKARTVTVYILCD